MARMTTELTRQRLKTPRAAAIAGIVFALLMGTEQVLIRLSIPTDPSDTSAWLAGQARTISLALTLVPFAGIAFLWFMGVVRDRLGHLEDQFFSTVFFGSGLLYLGLTFVSAAVAGGLLADPALSSGKLVGDNTYIFGHLVVYQINNIYALRMSGVFMISLGTIWLRTRTIPHFLIFGTYALALVLLLGVNVSAWFTLIFPAWVLMISLYILVGNLRRRSTRTERSPETA